MTESTRAYIYRVASAILVIAATAGLLTNDATIAAIGGLISAVMSAPLAVANTSTH